MLLSDLYDPADLTGYSRAALDNLPANRRVFGQWLPNRFIDDLDYRFVKGGAGLQDAAKFRSFDTEAPIGARPSVTRVRGELPPISRKLRLSEYDRLKQRKNADQAIEEAIESDAVLMVTAIANRFELARAEALATGKVSLEENDVIAEVDFGRQGNHTTAPGTLWSNTTNATVLTDLRTWYDRYVATNGEAPGALATSTAVKRLMQRNKEVIDAVHGSTAGKTMVTDVELNQILGEFNLPGVVTVDGQTAVNGAATRYLNEDVLLLLPAAVEESNFDGTDLGATLWGTTAEAADGEFGIEDSELPGIVAGVYSSNDPKGYWTLASAIGLPVLANPNLSLAADVK